MAGAKKLLKLKIWQARLEQAHVGLAEAQIEKLQRGLAYREQEAEAECNQARRVKAREEVALQDMWDKEKQRPSMFIGTDIFYDEDKEKFACQHDGVIAYGDTPAMACENFDHLWVYGK